MEVLMKVILCLILLTSGVVSAGYDKSYTADERIKVIFKDMKLFPFLQSARSRRRKPIKASLKAISKISEKYKLNIDINQLQFDSKKESLLGVHYKFKQVHENRPVSQAFVSISFDKKMKKVIRFYTTYRPMTETSPRQEKIREDQAIEIAWNQSKFQGELKELPNLEIAYENINGKEKLVYNIFFSVGDPVGNWNILVDAINGKILKEYDDNIYRRHYHPKKSKKKKLNLKENLKKLALKTSKTLMTSGPEMVWRADGRGVIFDPNPVTTLRRDDLEDSSDPEEFTAAYANVNLKNLTVKDNVYHLENDNIKLVDFDSPNIAPSTSNDGNWDAVRKDIKFNDVMTFYHLNLSMNYLKSIGYSKKKDIFPDGLSVDANGAGGGDNSYYQPSGKKLSFGHGCVDDNEDTDVILHELGHAIQDHIVGGFRGGDTGAIGEGFGDYWAASYSYTRVNGDYKPNWVFKWDGHNDCWNGRILNALNAKYDHKKSYSAHRRLGNHVTDELWSTPVFQAFKSLLDEKKATYDEIQKIMIEAHYGLAYGIKMRDMAISIIDTASRLFPDRGIEHYYINNFKRHNIIE